MKTQAKQARVKKVSKTTAVASNITGSTTTAQAPQAKPVVHNKKFPVQRISRTKMVQIINDTKGRFFTSTHIDKDGQARTMNAIKSNKPASELGYLNVYSTRDKGYRNINPQTLTDLSFGGVHYKATGKKPVVAPTV